MPHRALRLRPGDDLRGGLEAVVAERGLRAAWVVTCVGSLTDVHVRRADQPDGTRLAGRYEIVSLAGTLSATGGSHLHLAVADERGRVVGGHVLPGGNLVYTTAEVVIGYEEDLAFAREVDPETGFRELVIRPRS